MANRILLKPSDEVVLPPLPSCELPALYEDEAEEVWDMGDSDAHTLAIQLLHVCLSAHFANRRQYRVFGNMNLYYDTEREPGRGPPYVSPDLMVVRPGRRLPQRLASYHIGREGPPPALTMEVLSARSGQQRDLKDKLRIYAGMGIPEYILVDPLGLFLPQPLLLKRLQPSRRWQNEVDADGGVTSRLGFRVLIEDDGDLRVVDQATGRRYIRPSEAEREVAARRQAEERIRALEAEIRDLKAAAAAKKPTRRRKKQ